MEITDGGGGGGDVKQGLLLKPVSEQVGPATLTTIKKFIAHVDTSVVPIKFEHIRIPNSFGGGGGGGGGGGHGGEFLVCSTLMEYISATGVIALGGVHSTC